MIVKTNSREKQPDNFQAQHPTSLRAVDAVIASLFLQRSFSIGFSKGVQISGLKIASPVAVMLNEVRAERTLAQTLNPAWPSVPAYHMSGPMVDGGPYTRTIPV